LGGRDAINIVCKSLKYSVEEKQYLRGYRRGNQNGKFKINWQQDEEKHNTICVGHHYTQTNTNDVNKT
jgi:hypothetical protein